MAAAITRFSHAPEPARKDQPTAPRSAVQRRGQLSSPQGDNALVIISDVTAHGCSVRCASGWLRPGRFVSLGLEDGAPLQAIVRWARGDQAGLEFLRAVPSVRGDWQVLIALDS